MGEISRDGLAYLYTKSGWASISPASKFQKVGLALPDPDPDLSQSRDSHPDPDPDLDPTRFSSGFYPP